MKQVILIKNGEIALKGLNRASFEAVLIKNIKHALCGLGEIRVQRAQSTITVEPVAEEYDMDEAQERLRRVFGIAAFSCAVVVPKELDAILQQAPVYLRPELTAAKTFKVNAKRADKRFAYTSPQICAKTGEALLQAYPHLRVDVHHPDVTVTVEIRTLAHIFTRISCRAPAVCR